MVVVEEPVLELEGIISMRHASQRPVNGSPFDTPGAGPGGSVCSRDPLLLLRRLLLLL